MAKVRKEKTRENILEAAKEIFSEKGYHGTTVSDIIGRVGMAQGSFYNYFENKRSIFIELLQEFIDAIERAAESFDLKAVVSRETYSVMAISIATAIAYVFTENEALARIFFHEAMGIDEEINSIIDSAYQKLSDISYKFIERGREVGVIRKDLPSEMMAAANVGMATFLVNRFLRGDFKSFPPEQLIFTAVSIQLDGFLEENQKKHSRQDGEVEPK